LQRDLELGQAVLSEILASDIVVIGAPMYKFTIPSQLKSWVDRIAVAGRTFSYGPDGVKGLAGGKKVIIVSTRGGHYGADTPMAGRGAEHERPPGRLAGRGPHGDRRVGLISIPAGEAVALGHRPGEHL
jgi:FMN-dependent NADH-azoreductase